MIQQEINRDNSNCSLHVGQRDNNNNFDARHRRMVDVNLHPERCENSNIVTIDIPHDGTKRSFKRIQNRPRRLNQEKGNDMNSMRSFAYWYGEDDTDGSTFNYVQDEHGNVHGSLVDVSNHSVMQFAVEDGSTTVVITDSSDFRPEIEPPNNDEEDEGDDDDDDLGERNLSGRSSRSYLRKSHSTTKNQEQANRVLNDDSGANLDVMVVWTSKAECRNYGLDEGCTLTAETAAAMEARINLAIDETNTAFDLSGVQTQLFLAHAYRHESFNESSMSEDLTTLRNGGIPGTEENRAAYGADLVAMIVDDPLYCGIGYLGPRIDKMYSITAWNCATGYFSFGHEIGHNLGLRHDRGTESKCDHTTKFHYGYRDPQARFRTILAYNCAANQCDNNSGGGCTRIQRFSNDDAAHGWNGLPAGDSSNDNARKINNVKYKVAQYFPHGGTGGTTSTTSAPQPAPSNSPSSSPTVSPSSVPSQTPTSSPSSKPSPSPSCNDSPLEFLYQNQLINCAIASSQNFCSDPEIQAICPSTCGTCSNCVDTALPIKYFNTVKEAWQIKECSVVGNNPSTRCGFFGVSDACRATCGTC